MKTPRCVHLGVLVGCFVGMWGSSVGAQTTYDTTYAWDGSNSVGGFGNGGSTTTYGQTFVAPGGSLNDFTVYVNPEGGTFSMQADVYAWSGSLFGGNGPQGAVGPALYTSATSFLIDGSTPANPAGFVPVTVITGGVPLTAGDDYVALLTVSDPLDYAATNGSGVWGLVGSHVSGDGGGGFNFYNNDNNYGELNDGAWDDFGDFGDAAWTADFGAQSTPEPASCAFLASLGLSGIVCAYRRRRRSTNLSN